eukprot:SAG31_NODE_35987_length_317_cov_1.316514_1_plen_41_part_10
MAGSTTRKQVVTDLCPISIFVEAVVWTNQRNKSWHPTIRDQ